MSWKADGWSERVLETVEEVGHGKECVQRKGELACLFLSSQQEKGTALMVVGQID